MTRPTALALLACSCAAPSPPSTDLFPEPWPSEGARSSDGAIDLSVFPDGTGAPLRRQAESALQGTRGFGVSSGIFFGFDGALDPESLPRLGDTRADASVFVAVAEGEALGARATVDVRFFDDAGPFGGTNLLAVLPYPGIPLEPETLYAAVVTTRVRTADGNPLSPTETLDAEKLEAVDGYLEIQRQRFGDRLRYEVRLAPGAERCRVPPMLLQPLVENAIVHGLRERSAGGVIRVDAARADGALRIVVEDDGVGPGGSRHRGTGLGQKNVSERLRIVYGEGARLETRRAESGGYRCELVLPEGGPR